MFCRDILCENHVVDYTVLCALEGEGKRAQNKVEEVDSRVSISLAVVHELYGGERSN